MAEKQTKQPDFTVATSYLFLYNFFQFLGWAALFFLLVTHVVVTETYNGLYDAVKIMLNIFQTGAVLEIVHASVGLVRSNPVLTAVQVFSRVFLTWGIVYSVPETQNQIGVPLFLVAWSITEMVRYSFYTFGILGDIPPILTWLRYTLFIILYPIGVTGELISIYSALGPVAKSGLYSVPMPNVANISFSYHKYLIFMMISYIPVFPQLYFHMFAQRKKILGGGRVKKD